MKEGKKVIFYLDDSPTARMVLKEELEARGYEVYLASSPSEMEKILTKNNKLRKAIDLFVLDLNMPEMIGTQVGSTFSVVFEELKKTPFIIYSGEPQENVKKAIEEGLEFFGESFMENFSGYIEKGERAFPALLERIEKAFAKKKSVG